MKTAPLGGTGIEITRLGFGAWAIGGGEWEFGWGPQQDEESFGAIHRALELGVNWIDTAAAYGFGHSEEVVGRALRGLENPPYVFTKCSLLEGPGGACCHSLERDSIMPRGTRQPRAPRGGRDRPLPDPLADPARGHRAGMGRPGRAARAGLVRHIGVSNFSVGKLERIQQIAPVETLQPEYSLIERDAEAKLLPFAEREGIGVIVYSPMGSGMLTGAMTRERVQGLAPEDWRRRDERFNEPQLSENLALVERLQRVGERHNVTAGAVAVAWTLTNPAVDGAIVGFRSPPRSIPSWRPRTYS